MQMHKSKGKQNSKEKQTQTLREVQYTYIISRALCVMGRKSIFKTLTQPRPKTTVSFINSKTNLKDKIISS